MYGYSVSCFSWNSLEELFLLKPSLWDRIVVVSAVYIRKVMLLLRKPRILCFCLGAVAVAGGRAEAGGTHPAWNKTDINCFLQASAHVNSTTNLIILFLCYNAYYEAFAQGLGVISMTKLVLVDTAWKHCTYFPEVWIQCNRTDLRELGRFVAEIGTVQEYSNQSLACIGHQWKCFSRQMLSSPTHFTV